MCPLLVTCLVTLGCSAGVEPLPPLTDEATEADVPAPPVAPGANPRCLCAGSGELSSR